eukprot:CAMPEP_0171219040 /NCGR_PEP_ID=MMETSP0790-20130122/33512_1 /TAXON_ID=2925 /ORGANISM="Alexandrium catenella, Strain OF101" /LENGTH=68 /DNA_ID=CAMNT_0011684881 /DNA_START=160 /DNA_END=364 /DNA_ORIENTATION=+
MEAVKLEKENFTESGGAKQGPPKLISAQKHESAACGQTGVSTPILNVAVPPVAAWDSPGHVCPGSRRP